LKDSNLIVAFAAGHLMIRRFYYFGNEIVNEFIEFEENSVFMRG